MNTPVGATNHVVVRIDHQRATILPIDGSAAATTLQAHSHPTAQHGSGVRSEHEFFANVCTALEGHGAVLVTGGKTALADFRHYAEKHRPQTAKFIVAYETLDHATENQLRAFGRTFFEL